MKAALLKPALRSMQLIAAMLAIGACGKEESSPASAVAAPSATVAAQASAAATPAVGAPAPPASPALGGRTGELVNPDESTMVFLYHELAGIPAPLPQWVGNDNRVTFAPGPEKAARREQVLAEIQGGLAAVRNIGFIRLTLNDQLSDYDATYGEFTLRALAPSSTVAFRALQQEITLRFGNGRTAQIWALPAAKAQVVQDSFGYGRAVVLDLLLKVTAVQPATGGGAIVADVLEYEIRTQQGNKLLGRVQPAP